MKFLVILQKHEEANCLVQDTLWNAGAQSTLKHQRRHHYLQDPSPKVTDFSDLEIFFPPFIMP